MVFRCVGFLSLVYGWWFVGRLYIYFIVSLQVCCFLVWFWYIRSLDCLVWCLSHCGFACDVLALLVFDVMDVRLFVCVWLFVNSVVFVFLVFGLICLCVA